MGCSRLRRRGLRLRPAVLCYAALTALVPSAGSAYATLGELLV
jgi:hypothetical protein